jgi:DNA topoisomerase-1
VSDGRSRRGWRRLGRRRFRYVDAHDRPVTDEEALARIEALVIPPAWRDVWISPSPAARLQATGFDAAGRKQYLYHERHRAAQERAKFERLLELGALLPAFRARVDRHLRGDELAWEWSCAVAASVINKTWFRVGSDRHARRSRTYGVTTLTRRHVSVEGDEVRFCFRTKNRRLVRRSLVNARLAGAFTTLLALPGSGRLLRYEHDGELAHVSAATLNAYLGEHLGEGFTAKDFRTWGGTLLAATELERRGPSGSDGEARRALAAVMRKVGSELGNTPAVARASYVSPVVVDQYLAGRTLADFRRNGSSPRHLSASEAALVELLSASSRSP